MLRKFLTNLQKTANTVSENLYNLLGKLRILGSTLRFVIAFLFSTIIPITISSWIVKQLTPLYWMHGEAGLVQMITLLLAFRTLGLFIWLFASTPKNYVLSKIHHDIHHSLSELNRILDIAA